MAQHHNGSRGPATATTNQETDTKTRPPSNGAKRVVASVVATAHKKPAARSENRLVVPYYVRASPTDAGPQASEVLAAAGLRETRTLTGDERQALMKPTPRILAMAGAVADLLAAEEQKGVPVIRLRDLDAGDVRALHERAAFLRPRAARLTQAAQIASHQYAVAMSDLYDVLLRLRRAVLAAQGEWPEVVEEWRALLDFFDAIFTGAAASTEQEEEEEERADDEGGEDDDPAPVT